MKAKIKVLIVDDDPLARRALSEYVRQEEDLAVCGEADNLKQTLDAVTWLKPDIVLIDILGFESEEGGLQIIKTVQVHHRQLPLLAISSHDASLYAPTALQAGAKGYVMKQEASKIGWVIRKILKGERYVSGESNVKEKFRAFYDQKGAAVAFLDEDRESIYLYDGTPVAWLSGDSVYAFSGKHLGWFIKGWVHDHKGDYVLFTQVAIEGPVKPFHMIEFQWELKKQRPKQEAKETQPEKFIHSTSWSALSGIQFFNPI